MSSSICETGHIKDAIYNFSIYCKRVGCNIPVAGFLLTQYIHGSQGYTRSLAPPCCSLGGLDNHKLKKVKVYLSGHGTLVSVM